MQIREMNLKELDTIYEVLSQLHTSLSFKEFDDLVYDMRHMEYKMIGLFQRDKLITYAGVAVQTSFYYKRHLMIFDLVTDREFQREGYAKEMLEYLEVYAKTAMCENIVLSQSVEKLGKSKFYKPLGFDVESQAIFKKL